MLLNNEHHDGDVDGESNKFESWREQIEEYGSVISEDKGFYRFDLFSGGFEKKRCRRGAS